MGLIVCSQGKKIRRDARQAKKRKCFRPALKKIRLYVTPITRQMLKTSPYDKRAFVRPGLENPALEG
jgi:hypothetical protein